MGKSAQALDDGPLRSDLVSSALHGRVRTSSTHELAVSRVEFLKDVSGSDLDTCGASYMTREIVQQREQSPCVLITEEIIDKSIVEAVAKRHSGSDERTMNATRREERKKVKGGPKRK